MDTDYLPPVNIMDTDYLPPVNWPTMPPANRSGANARPGRQTYREKELSTHVPPGNRDVENEYEYVS